MKAEQMFKELGYEEHFDTEVYWIKRDNKKGSHIQFLTLEETYSGYDIINNENVISKNYTKEEHQAITQQMKELGWIK